jgi:hypothetical protein
VDAFGELQIERECFLDRGDVVETDCVGVPPHRPDQDDVTREGTAVVGVRWDEHHTHAPVSDLSIADAADGLARLPDRPVHDLRG